MENTFSLRVLSINGTFYEGKCRALVVPAVDGEYAFMAHHEEIIMAVTEGEIRITPPEGDIIIGAVSAGSVQFANNRCVLLVGTAERPEDIDYNRALEAKELAEEQIRQKKSLEEYWGSQAALARALTRLKVSGKTKKR